MAMPDYARLGLGIVSTAAALCYVATMAIYYARLFDAGIALEAEVRRRQDKTDALRAAVAAADRAGAAKSEFLARMSHELRTPLTAVIGYSQILREEAVEANDPQLRADVELIHEAGTYLLRLVNMILDLSKLEAGRIQLNMQPCALAALVHRAVDARRALLEQHGNSVVMEFDAPPDSLLVDGLRLQQVLESLLENAARHTQSGTIVVRTQAAVLGNDRAVAISVSDTGTGVDPELLPTLFETFTTTRDAADSRYGGTGLSLAIAHRLCRAMGGAIAVDSTWASGATFTVHLPVESRAEGGMDPELTPTRRAA